MKVVIPEAGTSPTATSSAPERSSVRFPVSASPHDGILDREVDFSAMKAELEALKLADERRQREVEALKSEKQKLQSRVSGTSHCRKDPGRLACLMRRLSPVIPKQHSTRRVW